jgi:hypothetical protein
MAATHFPPARVRGLIRPSNEREIGLAQVRAVLQNFALVFCGLAVFCSLAGLHWYELSLL